MWHTLIFRARLFPCCSSRCALKRTAPPEGSLKPVISMVLYYHLRGSPSTGSPPQEEKKKAGKRVVTVDAYVNKIHVSGGLGGGSATCTLAVFNTQGRLIIMNYGNTRYLSPFCSTKIPPSGVLLARPRTSFIFLPGLATLTPGFKSTVRYRSCLLRAKGVSYTSSLSVEVPGTTNTVHAGEVD